MQEFGNSPRQEAVPIVNRGGLSADQKKIISDIHEWLAALLSLPKQEAAQAYSFLPSLDADRRANVLLIDGARGTGKTTVLLTLLRMWADALTAAETQEHASIDDEMTRRVLKERRVIPLGILDMQPLTGRPALLLQLAGRLYRVADYLQPSVTNSADRGLCGDDLPRMMDEDLPASVRAWRQFARAVAIGQEDDPRKRQAQANPEDFALELEQSERQRMHIGERWRKFVDALLADMKASKNSPRPVPGGDDPCFVIPIDDADMNPDRGIELLELLRSIWHPRVVYLLTGDSKLFQELLFCHYKKQCPTLPDSQARQLALDVRGKVIPPAQRFDCRAEPDVSLPYLRRAGVLPPELDQRFNRWPDLQSALPQRWRVIIDVEQSLRAKKLPASGVARVLFEEAVKHAALSDVDEHRLLENTIRRTRDAKGLQINENLVEMRLLDQVAFKLQLDERRSISWNPSEADRWFLPSKAPASPPPAQYPDQEELPLSIVASIYLAASLASEEPSTRYGRSLSPAEYPLISSEFSIDGLSYNFFWPTPDWLDPLLFRQFLELWRQGLTKLRSMLASDPGQKSASDSQRAAMQSAAFLWITTLCELAGETVELGGTLSSVDDAEPRLRRWEAIGASIARLAQQEVPPRTQKAAFVQWAKTDALFFGAKESGLLRQIRAALLDGWLDAMSIYIEGKEKASKYWSMVAHAISGRITRISRAAASHGDFEAQLRAVCTAVDDPPFKGIWKTSNNSIKEYQEFVRKTYYSQNEYVGLAVALDAMRPDPSGLSRELEPFSRLFSGERVTEALKLAHFRKQVALRMDRIRLTHIPDGLETDWLSLWKRVRFGFDTLLTNLAARTDLLTHLKSTDARSGWRSILQLYLAESFPEQATKLWEELGQLLDRLDLYPYIKFADDEPRASVDFQNDNVACTFSLMKASYDIPALEPIVAPLGEIDASYIVSMVIVFSDIVADEEDLGGHHPSSFPTFKSGAFISSGGNAFPIPVPAWTNRHDFGCVVNALEIGITQAANLTTNWGNKFDFTLGYFLFSVASVLSKRNPASLDDFLGYLNGIDAGFSEDVPSAVVFWQRIRKVVSDLYRPTLRSHRIAVVREWANLGAPLLAAPETGMASDSARYWLCLWDGTANSVDRLEVQQRLSEFRIKRAQAILGPNSTAEDAKNLLKDIDARNPDHAWVQMIEGKLASL